MTCSEGRCMLTQMKEAPTSTSTAADMIVAYAADLLIVDDALAIGRRAEALNILLDKLSLADALDVMTSPRLPHVGDILACCWFYGDSNGARVSRYEQTRYTFYQVTKVTAKTLAAREIDKIYISRGRRGEGDVLPVVGKFMTSEKLLRGKRFSFPVDPSRGEHKWRYSIRIEGAQASLWDGEPCHENGEPW